jgi:cytochrome c5
LKRLLRWSQCALALVAIALAGCKSSLSAAQSRGATVPPSDELARAAGMPEPEIASARQLYTTKCARCHKYYDPSQYDDQEWQTWMRKMSKKAHLKADQQQLLSRYLETFRSAAPAK